MSLYTIFTYSSTLNSFFSLISYICIIFTYASNFSPCSSYNYSQIYALYFISSFLVILLLNVGVGMWRPNSFLSYELNTLFLFDSSSSKNIEGFPLTLTFSNIYANDFCLFSYIQFPQQYSFTLLPIPLTNCNCLFITLIIIKL